MNTESYEKSTPNRRKYAKKMCSFALFPFSRARCVGRLRASGIEKQYLIIEVTEPYYNLTL